MKFQPLADRVLVKRAQVSRTKGGILLPDNATERPLEGEVIAVGAGKLGDGGNLAPMAVKVGDRVLFAKYAGSDIKVDDDDLVILREDDVLGLLS